MITTISRLAGIALLFLFPLAVGAADVWTLPLSIKRALEVSPEMRIADAEIGVREGELKRDSAWPNPTVEARVDRKLGIETGSGGNDVTQLAITQPIPLSRLSSQRARGEANVAVAQASRDHQRLQFENQVARAFNALQVAEAKYRIAEQRLQAAQQYDAGGGARSRDRLVRYLAPLDRARLTILRESARQSLATVEGEQREAALRFRQLLALPNDAAITVTSLTIATLPSKPADFDVALDAHPAMIAGQRDLDAARRGIDVARASRLADPTVSVFRERDVLGGDERSYYGVVVGVQIPLWNQNRGDVARAAAETNRADAALSVRRRELESALRDSRFRLERLIDQAQHYAKNVLGPSERLLELTRRGFATGEIAVLALLDANNSYFEAEQRQLELLAEAAAAAADLRLSAGQSLVEEGRP